MIRYTTSASPQDPSRNIVMSALLRLLPLVLLLGAFALRLFRLGAESLWYDETVSVYLATQSLPDLIAHTARDIHPPAYYALLHLWRLLAKPTVAFGLEFLYAWPSLFLDVLVVALSFAIARRVFGLAAARWTLVFATLHPMQLWFAQEVRMYSLGAFCVMLTLWCVSSYLSFSQTRPHASIAVSNAITYVAAAILGLYTLYYFLFWLAVLNLCVISVIWHRRAALRQWIALQLVIVIGWLPWLPTFFRQSLTPPVPPWRVPWQNTTEFLAAAQEAIAALWTGHTFPYAMTLPWAATTIGLAVAFYVYAKNNPRPLRIIWLTLSFGPTLLLLIVSAIGPPLYHVRYVATYAPVFVLLVGAALVGTHRSLQAPLLLILTLVSGAALQEQWTNPRYAADDHRQAVATLARSWRPGDAILVNAGWAYTILQVYWPDELPSPLAARPPSLGAIIRLDNTPSPNIANLDTNLDANYNAPVVFRTGSIEGDPDLGWGLPQSDFFAVSRQATEDALAQIAARYSRLWHYRIYDTVSDPDGRIRQWLGAYTTQEFSQPIPGRDFALLEVYRTGTAQPMPANTQSNINFPDAGVRLSSFAAPASLAAGEFLYVATVWEDSGESATIAPAASLRLYDAAGNLIVQNDGALPSVAQGQQIQPFALPIPAATPPGDYTLALVVYATESLQPVIAFSPDGKVLPSTLPLGSLELKLSLDVPQTPSPLVRFDYIELLSATLPTTTIPAGIQLGTTWVWRARPSAYQDHYRAQIALVDGSSDTIYLSEFDLGSNSYPSSQWTPGYPVAQTMPISIPQDLAPARYQVQLSVIRASDGQVIAAQHAWLPWTQPFATLGSIEVGPSVGMSNP